MLQNFTNRTVETMAIFKSLTSVSTSVPKRQWKTGSSCSLKPQRLTPAAGDSTCPAGSGRCACRGAWQLPLGFSGRPGARTARAPPSASARGPGPEAPLGKPRLPSALPADRRMTLIYTHAVLKIACLISRDALTFVQKINLSKRCVAEN